MALTGLQINKLLPRTNCKECGSNTCLAFAMKLAGKKAELAECPYASDEAKQVLGAAAEPPIRGVALGPLKSLKLGEETVLYRHEKTFVNKTALAVNVNVGDDPGATAQTLAAVREYTLERVGERMVVDMVAITHTDADSPNAFASLAQKAYRLVDRPLVLRSSGPKTLKALAAAAQAVQGAGALLFAADPSDLATAAELADIARDTGHALAITAPDLDALVHLAASLKDKGIADLFLAPKTHSLAESFQTNTVIRRAALKDAVKALGFPLLRFLDPSDSLAAQTARAASEIAKYGGICVLPSFDAAQLAVLLTLRLNLFTDPQKPIQVEPKFYAIGDPGPDAPVFVTTNFSLTYFLVSGELENAGLSAWLAVPDCEGMSVLTAWAAGKFSGGSVAKFVKESGIEEKLGRKRIVVPGYAAVIRGELEDGLPGWDVMVGPQEAADIESFIKMRLC